MTTGFKAQMTTHNSLQGVEKRLFELCKANGLPDTVAKEVAHTFTHFVLGYITEEGVAQTLIKNNVPKNFAIEITEAFSKAKSSATKAKSKVNNRKPVDGSFVFG